MDKYRRLMGLAIIIISLAICGSFAHQNPGDVPQTDSSKIAPDGTAYVTRVVPVPTTISPEAQKVLARVVSDAVVAPDTRTVADWYGSVAGRGW